VLESRPEDPALLAEAALQGLGAGPARTSLSATVFRNAFVLAHRAIDNAHATVADLA